MTVSTWQPQASSSPAPTNMDGDWHIVSLVAYCQPEQFTLFKQHLDSLPHAQLHADDNHAKLVITVEAETSWELSERMDHLRDHPALMTLQMVYHQDDSLADDKDNDNPTDALSEATVNHQ